MDPMDPRLAALYDEDNPDGPDHDPVTDVWGGWAGEPFEPGSPIIGLVFQQVRQVGQYPGEALHRADPHLTERRDRLDLGHQLLGAATTRSSSDIPSVWKPVPERVRPFRPGVLA